jgi:hypothetical protein
MSVDSKHPDFDEYEPVWTLMRDADTGERAVRLKSTVYLPMPSGFEEVGVKGQKMYDAYAVRAQYPDLVNPTLAGMVGVIHRIAADIKGLEKDKPLAKLKEKCTKDGLTLEGFHQRITTELLLTGRYSILTDVASEGDGTPYFAGYTAEMLRNWEPIERSMFVLDESRRVHNDGNEFDWVEQKQYRVLRLRDKTYTLQVYGGKEGLTEGELVTPVMRGGSRKALEEIPLVVVGPRDVTLDIDNPPLLGVAPCGARR